MFKSFVYLLFLLPRFFGLWRFWSQWRPPGGPGESHGLKRLMRPFVNICNLCAFGSNWCRRFLCWIDKICKICSNVVTSIECHRGEIMTLKQCIEKVLSPLGCQYQGLSCQALWTAEQESHMTWNLNMDWNDMYENFMKCPHAWSQSAWHCPF